MREILEPAEAIKTLQPRLHQQLRRVVPLLALNQERRILGKGTGTLVRFASRHLIVTAKHVVDELEALGQVMTCSLELEETGMPKRVPTPTRVVPIELGPTIVASNELDILVFPAPSIVADDPALDWYDGEAGAEVSREHASIDWYATRNEQAAIPFVIAGFGNASHFTIEAQRLELLGSSPILCYVSSWDSPMHPTPQIHLIPDIDGPPIDGLNSIEQAIARNHEHKTARGGEIVGGYSGGPVARVGRNGEFLVGIVYEGGRRIGGAEIAVYARPWSCIADIILNTTATP